MVGIGGIGMSSIAEVLLARGYSVSGSDLQQSEITQHLQSLGAEIFEGHAASHVADVDVVVYSSAVDAQRNPETVEAKGRRIPIIKRADMLGELMRTKYGVAIAGTHGKTTTTTMAGLVVSRAGFDPTIIVGGKVAVFGSNAVAGEGDIIVIEADEYDRAFLRLTPSIAVITSIDEEHLDIYRDLADIKDSFIRFANSIPFFGSAIACIDDEHVRSVLTRIDRRVVTYGLTQSAEVRAENIQEKGLQTSFDVTVSGQPAGRVALRVPGMHNLRNALAAVAVGLELDIPVPAILEALYEFVGVQRRFDILSTAGDIIVVDDYAHHPVEVAATLETAAHVWPERRIVAAFQPHLYSRTRDLQLEFARAFFDADVVLISEIYPAREKPIEGVSGRQLVHRAAEAGHGDVSFVESVASLPAALLERVRPGDAVVLMGAGDIWRQSRVFAQAVSDREQQTT
jgi:UDP-N-acetylmuramate--alanine ligase